MSKKCRAYSESALGREPADNRKAFYAGWEAAQRDALLEALREVMRVIPCFPDAGRLVVGMEDRYNAALERARAVIKDTLSAPSRSVPSDCTDSHKPAAYMTEAVNEHGVPAFFCASEIVKAGPGLVPLYTARPHQPLGNP